MGRVVLSDAEASMMEQGKAAAAAATTTTTTTLPSQNVSGKPRDPTVAERERFEAMNAIFKLVLTLFVTGTSLGGAVALLVMAFLNAEDRIVVVFLALTCAAFGVTGYGIIQHGCDL